MIVRISTEGQYEVEDVAALNDLDNAAVAMIDGGDEAAFRDAYARLLEFIRASGKPVPGDELAASDLILPPPDVTLAEARSEFTGEGLLPG